MIGSASGPSWDVKITPPTHKVKSYYEETAAAIQYVYENKTGKLQVLLSGGVDSQYVCQVLLKLGINFEAVVIELNNSQGFAYNAEDTNYAYEFANSHGIKVVRYDLNFDEFVESGKITELAEATTCSAAPIVSTMHAITQLDGFTILGSDPPYLKLKNDIWYFEANEDAFALERFYSKYNLSGCPYMLTFTAGQTLSFLLDPTIVKLGNGQIAGKTGSNSSKSHVFNNGTDFNLPVYDYVTKSRIKMTGHEQINKSAIANHPNLKIFAQYKNIWYGEYLEPYNDIVTRLSVNQ